MRELNVNEIEQVFGGTAAGDIAMGVAGAWASTVSGAAFGAVVGGPVGALGGAAIGFALGVLTVIGYSLSSK
ncbi:hypothetical protein [Colwellia piezophila]|uniref:hypothetical protein n=1 Tax=Colwellia piezophila TaxID=211668 RepID=UPI000375AA6D|nr:hypothetical protein [Colwellia piezophila]